LLGITSFFLLATQVMRWDLTLTTGLSAKNLVIYMLATFIAMRMIVGRTSITAAGRMQAAFILQIAYAIFTFLVAALVIKYQGYDLVDNGIKLKGGLIDYFIFFLVFLFGVRTLEDGVTVIKWILVGAVFANLATILDTVGIVNLGYAERIDGRTQGALGESNQYAAYIVLFLPGLVAAAVGSRGAERLAWLVGTLISVAALVMTGSRGGFVGLAVACVAGAWLYRNLASRNRVYSRAAGWILGSLVVLVVFLSFSKYGGMLTERVFGQTSSIDAVDASSGRTEIWAGLLATMFANPITFITGFGWDVYWSMPFHFSPHNHYLALWFNLGLIGLFTGCYLLFSAIARARRASLTAQPPARGQLIAFVMGGIALSGAVFFVDLYEPWFYCWMYTGVVMRIAYCVETAEVPAIADPRARLRGPARDPYGWTTAGVGR
jgi:O-antigen ligase